MKLPYHIECRGHVKCSGVGIGGFKWKTGTLFVHYENGVWKVNTNYDTDRLNILSHPSTLNSKTLDRVFYNAFVLIIYTQRGIVYRLKGAPVEEMKKMYDVLQEIKNGANSFETENKATVKASFSSRTSPSPKRRSPEFTRMKTPKDNRHLSPKNENKEKKTSARIDLLEFSSKDSEEKENRTTPHKISDKNVFHQKGSEKSRETLKSIGTGDFYSKSNSSQLSDSSDFRPHKTSDKNVFLQKGAEKSRETLKSIGTGGFYSKSISSQLSDPSDFRPIKRLPGLMPDPTPTKRQRLSDVPYTWGKKKSDSDIKTKTQALHGFSNLGNTCYMNAILQSLFAVDTFTSDLLYGNARIKRHMSQHSLYIALGKLILSRKKVNIPEVCRRELLKNVKSTISLSAKRFSGYQQHDAHEFLEQVLDQLKEEVIKVNKSTPSPIHNSTQSSQLQQTPYMNPTVENFEFEVQHTITCVGCNEEITKLEQFNDLSLDIPPKRDPITPHSVQDAFDYFFRNESIEYKCEKCGCMNAEVTHKYTRLPRILILHLKRYSYDITGSSNRKVGQTIDIPRYLTFQSHCKETTSPPFPPLNIYSYSKSCEPANDETVDGTSKRKLEYSEHSFNFKRKDREHDSHDKNDSAANGESPKLTSLKSPVDGDSGLKYNEQDEDVELARALELSLQESSMKPKDPADVGDDSNDASFQKVLEMSQRDAAGTGPYTDTALAKLSEDELVELAIKESLTQSLTSTPVSSNFSYSRNDDDKKSIIKDCSVFLCSLKNQDNTGDVAASENGLPGGCGVYNSPSTNETDQSTHGNETKRYQNVSFSDDENDLVTHAFDLPVLSRKEIKKESISPLKGSEKHQVICISSEDEDVLKSPKNSSQKQKYNSVDEKDCHQVSTHPEIMEQQSTESDISSFVDSVPTHKRTDNIRGKPYTECIVLSSESDEVEFCDEKSPKKQSEEKLVKNCDRSNLSFSDHSKDSSFTKEVYVRKSIDSPCERTYSPKELDNKKLSKSASDHKLKKRSRSEEKSSNSSVNQPRRTSSSAVKALRFFNEDEENANDSIFSSKSSAIEDLCKSLDHDDDLLRKEADLFMLDDKENTAPEDHCHSENARATEDKTLTEDKDFDNDVEYFEPQKIENEDGDLPYSYRLMSIVNHIGASSVVGHYLSDVCDLKTRSWYSCDDSHVSAVTEDEVRKKRQKSGYIFFYMCKEIYDDLQNHYMLIKSPSKNT